ncbi:hypothetical protein [Enterococcus sp. AZ196]|uniref:hypothetical protein n=1 Tax=Enterococcus sp. AZ196 TaxID=2774659 RepID=UPI003D27501A
MKKLVLLGLLVWGVFLTGCTNQTKSVENKTETTTQSSSSMSREEIAEKREKIIADIQRCRETIVDMEKLANDTKNLVEQDDSPEIQSELAKAASETQKSIDLVNDEIKRLEKELEELPN